MATKTVDHDEVNTTTTTPNPDPVTTTTTPIPDPIPSDKGNQNSASTLVASETTDEAILEENLTYIEVTGSNLNKGCNKEKNVKLCYRKSHNLGYYKHTTDIKSLICPNCKSVEFQIV